MELKQSKKKKKSYFLMKWPVWISVLDNEDDKPCYNETTSKTLEVKKTTKEKLYYNFGRKRRAKTKTAATLKRSRDSQQLHYI